MSLITGILASAQPSKPIVTGGTLTSDATYYYRTFTANGDLGVSNSPISCDILIVGAGGSGSIYGGGGGAGGYRSLTSQSLSPATYPVVIGQGGAAVTSGSDVKGNEGTASSINSNSAAGGGYGGAGFSNSFNLGGSGGSGGGGGFPNNTGDGSGGAGNTPSTSPSQGNNGGTGRYLVGTYILGGGGGGADGVGANYNYTGGGQAVRAAGGAALTNSTYSTSSKSYAGGGKGQADDSSNPTVTANTGFGGSAGYWNGSSQQPSVAGASGVVVVKYLKSAVD
jgi:hypothetical protein